VPGASRGDRFRFERSACSREAVLLRTFNRGVARADPPYGRRDWRSAKMVCSMSRWVLTTLVIFALGLLPGLQGESCPSAHAGAVAAHAHADGAPDHASHSHGASEAGHHHSHPSKSTLGIDAPAQDQPDHDPSSSLPSCCRDGSQAGIAAVWTSPPSRAVDTIPEPVGETVVAVLRPQLAAMRDLRRLRANEHHSPYARTRAPLLI